MSLARSSKFGEELLVFPRVPFGPVQDHVRVRKQPPEAMQILRFRHLNFAVLRLMKQASLSPFEIPVNTERVGMQS